MPNRTKVKGNRLTTDETLLTDHVPISSRPTAEEAAVDAAVAAATAE